jgi:pimeloyl-ACP methyl ester carboxylesterase/DNA-binding CsgD family transcriptional regulator
MSSGHAAMLLTNQLKDRELDIIRLMARGLSNHEIGRQLYLARETIRWYNKQIYTKLGVHNRTHAVTRAKELGLLTTATEVSIETPPVQYVKSGDAYIAYQVIGSGPIDILYIGGFINHLECVWEQPLFAQMIMQLTGLGRVILVDKRGFGLSDRQIDSLSLEQAVEDIDAVLEAVDSQRTIIIGTCEGAPASTLSAVRYPNRIQGLILINAIVKGSRSPGFPWALPSDKYEQIFETVRQEWGGPYGLEFYVPDADDAFRQWWAKFLRLSASPGTALKAVHLLREIDMSDILPQVQVPTLVLHSRDNQVVRVGSGRYVASQINKAEYIEIDDNAHVWWWNADDYLHEIECFIERLVQDKLDSHCA